MMLGLYTTTQNTLECVLFMYAFESSNITEFKYVDDHVSFSQDDRGLFVCTVQYKCSKGKVKLVTIFI